MNTIKHGVLLAALAGALGASGAAGAATFASSILNITNFRLLHSNGTAYSVGDFSTLAGTNDAHATASLNGVFANGADSRAISNPVPPNVAQQCVGTCYPVPADNFTPIAGLPPVINTFGYADQNLSGVAISNSVPAGANASTRADASTAMNAVASGNSDVGTSTTFNFTLGSSDTMTISFNADPYTRALVTAGAMPISNANARLSWSLNILNLSAGGASVINFAPTALNAASAVSATDGMPADVIYAPGMAAFSATTALLTAGNTYQLTIQHNSLANALQQELPEPATLAVLATGLLAMSTVRRRRG